MVESLRMIFFASQNRLEIFIAQLGNLVNVPEDRINFEITASDKFLVAISKVPGERNALRGHSTS
jgi:hypothetical protein